MAARFVLMVEAGTAFASRFMLQLLVEYRVSNYSEMRATTATTSTITVLTNERYDALVLGGNPSTDEHQNPINPAVKTEPMKI